jgi:hypothetical protein
VLLKAKNLSIKWGLVHTNTIRFNSLLNTIKFRAKNKVKIFQEMDPQTHDITIMAHRMITEQYRANLVL